MIERRTLAVAVGICAVLAPHGARAQKSPMARAAYARAQEHLVAARFDEAAVEMETAVRYEPRYAMGWYLLASASRRAGQCDRAVAAYRHYMELRPAEPDPYFGAALCLRAVGDRAGAIEAFERYIATDSRPASREFVEAARGQVADLKRERTAAATATATDADRPPSASPTLVEARQLREHGRADEAIARYRAEVAAHPENADAHTELGTLLVSMRNFKEAIDELRATVRLVPDAATAWYNLAFALREADRAAEAVDAYRRYITFKPRDADPHYGLGRALVTLGRDDQALSAFRAYVALETRPTELRWVKKARAEIARIELAGRPTLPGPAPSPPGASARPTPPSPPAAHPPAARQP